VVRTLRSEAKRELVEGGAYSFVHRYVNSEFVVPEVKVLYERVPGRDGASRGEALQSTHRS
jgi:hypothetical protein